MAEVEVATVRAASGAVRQAQSSRPEQVRRAEAIAFPVPRQFRLSVRESLDPSWDPRQATGPESAEFRRPNKNLTSFQ